MANNYFAFKEFTIYQDRCAMKVCTDACLFGAWAATLVKEGKPNRILDIGTGTGLLSLMLAQVSASQIDAIDVDAAASEQARGNISNSKFSDQITVTHTRLQDFNPQEKYDFIICNPPFYENQLRSPDGARNRAMHSSELSMDELASCISRLLDSNGKAVILLAYPHDILSIFTAKNVYAEQVVDISNKENSKPIRSMIRFGRDEPLEMIVKNIIIRTNVNEYSPTFKSLLKDYYLEV